MKEDIFRSDSQLEFPHVLLIDASAGSGKTQALAARFVQFLLSGKIPHNDLANILAITFTNNAAREMKERIISRLKRLALGLADPGTGEPVSELLALGPEEIRARAEKAVEEIIDRYSDFHVQTIDSFMSRILRRSALELGMEPDHEITGSYETLLADALGVLSGEFGRAVPFTEVDGFLEMLNQSESGRFIWNPAGEMARQFEVFLLQEGKVLEELAFEDHWPRINAIFEDLCGLYREIENLGFADALRAGVGRGIGRERGGGFDPAEFFAGFSPGDCGLTKKGFRGLAATAEGRTVIEKVKSCVRHLADRVSLARYAPYVALYNRFKAAMEKAKRRNEMIHFDDINKRLARYIQLEIVPEIFCRLGDVLYHYLLDEFQDTDRVQWENIQPLLEEAYARGGSLFAVGDIKQAIFLFRKADYRIMRDLAAGIRGRTGPGALPPSVRSSARIATLDFNYRSGGEILRYVDAVFKDRLRSNLGTALLAEDRTGLTAYRQSVPGDREGAGYVRTTVIAEAGEEFEKEALLAIIADVRERYALREIAVLARENAQVEKIVGWLTEGGIRAASFSSLDIRKRKIIMEIASLLAFLDSPIDDLSFASFVTGDIFLKYAGLDGGAALRDEIADMILEKKIKRDNSYLYVYFRNDARFGRIWQDSLERLYQIVGYYPLYDLTFEIYRTFRVFEKFPQETAFLIRFLEAIVDLEARGMASIKDLRALIASDARVPALEIVLPDYVDAVRVMTFHKAKGLGFAVAINMFYEPAARRSSMFFDRDRDRLLVRHITAGMRDCDPHLAALHREACIDDRIQELNLMYVALTRAKDELYNLVVRPERGPGAIEPIDLLAEYTAGSRGCARKVEPAAEPAGVNLPRRSGLEAAGDTDRNWSLGRHLQAREGEFVHAVIAGIEHVDENLAAHVDSLIAAVAKRAGPEFDPEKVKRMVVSFVNAPGIREWFEVRPGRKVLREAEYVREDGAVVRMDRVVIDAGAITLIDFKTGTAPADEYRVQIAGYRRILSRVYPGEKITCYLAYVESGTVVEAS